jgi:hypothetical protein
MLRVLTTIALIGCLQEAAPAHTAQGGIRGTVLWGPVAPGPARAGEAEEAPLSATFAVFRAAEKVGGFKSDDKGRFELSLPAGVYLIVPDNKTPVPNPQGQKTRVTVAAQGFTEVTIRLDTGMR